jgi:subtilisin family serine protease
VESVRRLGFPAQLIRVRKTADPNLFTLHFSEALSSTDLMDLARRISADTDVVAVLPLLKRRTGWAAAGSRLVVSAKKGRLGAVKAHLAQRGISHLRQTRVPDTALFDVGEAFEHDAVAASLEIVHPDIRSAEPELYKDYRVRATVDDPMHSEQWFLSREGADEVPGEGSIHVHAAWDVTLGNPQVVVGIIDTGTDVNHEDLAANIVGGFDAIDGDDDPDAGCTGSFDGSGEADSCPANAPFRDSHGTSVSGTVAAVGNNQVGLAGVCPQCALMPIRFIGEGLGSALNTAETFIRATDDGAWILNNSWGPGASIFFPLGQAERDAFAYARENGRDGLGTVILFAAGNETTDVAVDPYAAHPYAIAVAASTNLDDWAYYSNYGREIDVAAPSQGGVVQQDSYGIATTDVTGEEGYSTGDYNPDFGGTSAASPVAAGVAGLILSTNPDLTAEQVRLVLAESAEKITATQVDWEPIVGVDLAEYFAYSPAGHSLGFGWGRVHAARAVSLAATSFSQGGACGDHCNSCAPDGTCEMPCRFQSDCLGGSVCEKDGTCRSPLPSPTDIGQPCVSDCDWCSGAIDSNFQATEICTAECTLHEDCPTGFICRTIEDDGLSVCTVYKGNGGARNFYRNCRFAEVVFTDAGKGFCSEMCFGSGAGDCPVNFHCGPASCECAVEVSWGCLQYNCTESTVSDSNHPTDICFPDPGFGDVCEDDADCGPGDYCNGEGACVVDDREGCAICGPCQEDADCAPGEICIQGEVDLAPFCSRGCETDADCPGNAACRDWDRRRGRLSLTCRAPDDTPETPGCTAGFQCTVPCRDDVPCGDGEICEEGSCIPEPDDSDDKKGDDDEASGAGCGCAQKTGGEGAPWLPGAAALGFLLVAFFRRRP